MNIPTIIALVLVAAFILGLIGLALYRRSLARLSLQVADRVYRHGEVLKGTMRLEARASLSIESTSIVLVCTDTTDRGDGLPHTMVYSSIPVTTAPFNLSKGDLRPLEFSFVIPEKLPNKGVKIAMPERAEKWLEPVAELAASRRAKDIDWNIKAEVETSIVSLYASKRVEVSLE